MARVTEVAQNKETEHSASFHIRLMTNCGWLVDPTWPKWKRMVYTPLRYLQISLIFSTTISFFVNMLITASELDVFLEGFSLFCVNLVDLVKIFPFFFAEEKLQRCLRLLREMEAAGAHWRSPEPAIFRAAAARGVKGTIATCSVSWISWVLQPLFSDPPPPNSKAQALPMQSWMVIDTSSPDNNLVAFLIQVPLLAHLCLTWCLFTPFYIMMARCPCVQLADLCEGMREMKQEVRMRTRNAVDAEATYRRHMENDLHRAIRHHQAILRFVESLESLLAPVIFSLCLGSVLLFCVLSYQATTGVNSFLKMVTLAGFILFEFGELAFFCSAGAELLYLGAEVGDAAFHCGWEDCSPSFKSSVRFMILRAQRVPRITALGFSTLSLRLFAQMIEVTSLKPDNEEMGHTASFHVRWMTNTGWWIDPEWPKWKQAIVQVVMSLHGIFLVVMVISFATNMAISVNEMEIFLDSFTCFCANVVNLVKVFPFFFAREKLVRCFQCLGDMEVAGSHWRSQHPANYRRSALRTSRAAIISCLFSGMAWAVQPLLSQPPPPDSAAQALPMQAWIPIDSRAPGMYIPAFAIQLPALMHLCMTWVIFTPFYVTLVRCGRPQLMALCEGLREMRESVPLRKRSAIGAESAYPQLMDLRLRTAIEHHQAIFRFVDSLESLLSPVIFSLCLGTVLLFCCLSLLATSGVHSFMKLVTLTGFMVFQFLELAFFCSAGSDLLYLGAEVGDVAFHCGWEDCSPSFKSSVRFMILRAQRVPRITALGFSTLSLRLFAQLLRSSYSFYALLRQIQGSATVIE